MTASGVFAGAIKPFQASASTSTPLSLSVGIPGISAERRPSEMAKIFTWPEATCAGIFPQQIDKFGDRIDAQARMHDERARLGRQHGDEREVLGWVVRHFREQQRVDGERAAQTDADRVA